MPVRTLVNTIVIFFMLTATAGAAAGDRDPDFNHGQPVLIDRHDASQANVDFDDVLVDGQGRTVAGATFVKWNGRDSTVSYGLIARLRSDGAFDSTFGGGDGVIEPRYDGGSLGTRLGGILRDPLGRLGAGFDLNDSKTFGAVRYQENGVEDGDYGDGGLATVDASAAGDPGNMYLVRALGGSDGSTTFVGQMGSNGANTARLVRLNADGALDTSFGTGGRASIVLPVGLNAVGEVADATLYADGRVLLVGGGPDLDGNQGFMLVRLTAQGKLDPTFDHDGIVRLQAGTPYQDGTVYSAASDATIGPDGAIYVTGAGSGGNSQEIAVAKLDAAGNLAPGFGVAHTTLADLQPGHQGGDVTASVVALQSDGKVLVAGPHSPGDLTAAKLAIVRYTTAGKVDTTFGTNGAVFDKIGPTNSGVQVGNAALTKAGKLVVVGDTNYDTSPGTIGFISRYIAREPSDFHPPENVQPPGLTGVPKPGQQLTCTPGQWSNSPTSTTVVWDRAPRTTTSPDDPAWAPIAGTTGAKYTLQQADLGSRVRCHEVATNGDGSDTAPSPSKRVDADVPASVRGPVLTGTPVVGQTLACDVGEWSNGPDLTIAWKRDGDVIAGATTKSYVVTESDRRHRIGCVVSASNDVGPAVGPQPSNTMLAVGYAPTTQRPPHAIIESTGAKATDYRATCDDPGAWDEDYGAYDYRWLREGAEIAGATGKTYDATADDLGRNIACQAFSTNPAGRSEGATSNEVLVPLPAASSGPPGRIFQAGGFNALDPTNMLAVPGEYLAVIGELSDIRLRYQVIDWRNNVCPSRYPNAPKRMDFAAALQRGHLYREETCAVIVNYSSVAVTLNGIFWHGGACSVPGDASTSGPTCPQLHVDVEPFDPAHPPEFTPDELYRLGYSQPVRTLWDFNEDGRVDAACDASAPILRSLYSRGTYHARAVVITATSAQTGNYPVIDHTLVAHPRSEGQRGQLRDGQPFACRTSIDPPPEREQPCTTEATIGRVHVEGNLCPISMRRIPPGELDSLPDDVQAVLEQQALAGPLRRRSAVAPGAIGGFRAAPGSTAYDAAANLSALSTLPDTQPATVPNAWAKKLEDVKHYDAEAAQFAMDQIYIARGTAKVNGIDVDPRNGSSLVMVPSDAGGAIDTVKKMTLSAKDVGMSLGNVPIGNPGQLTTNLADRLDVAPPTLREVNLDQIGEDIRSKLNLGPFKLAGDTKLRLADDGSAFLDAHAELPGLLGGPGSSPIRTDVTVHADPAGHIKLEGIHLEVGKAYLAAVKIKDLRLDYDGAGLSVKGQLLFPPVDAGIAINKFRLSNTGAFQELDVDYLAGAGQGIPVGPGIFMTKLGGGFSLDPDEIRGRATFGVGPSTGGGCPTAGIEAGFVVHFAPAPFYVKATGQVQILCIPIVDTTFYADSTGLVDVAANLHFDAGPVYFGAKLHGALQLPRWQIDLHGEGGIRHLISAEIKAIIGNLGVAGCARVKLLFITLAAGAGVRFSNGHPPLSFSELANNIHIFTGCDLTSWSPFGRDVRTAPTGSGRTFELPDDGDVVALEVIGSGGSPRVRLRAPDGKLLDASAFTEDLTHGDGVDGLLDPANDRTVLFVKGQKGEWTIEPAAGSPAIVELRHASVLPKPEVTATVGGAGAARQLRYTVAKVPGQQVRFVEHSKLGQRVITTVKEGGAGTKAFTTSEGKGTARTVVAEVVQDGMPRANLTVAHFSAPAPSPTRPRHVRIRKGRITWAKSAYAARYEVVVTTGGGNRVLLDATRPVVRRKGAVKASVVAISPAGRRSKPGVGKVSSRSGTSPCRRHAGHGRRARCRRHRTGS
jgi:uncharacterized delta-60 repeat protein